MDTSEAYIKMCEKAEEIQTLRREEKHGDTGKWKAGDFWTTVFDSDGIFVVPDSYDVWADEPYYTHHPIECIWLPRQDQLQEILLISDIDFVELLECFYWSWAAYKTSEKYPWRDYIEDGDKKKILTDFASLEQLWLAFVMKEKFNKIWNGNDWITE